MTKEEAKEILVQFCNWNIEQKSLKLSFEGRRTIEDDIYDERRKLIRKAYKILNSEELEE
jgi:hypothetical protein